MTKNEIRENMRSARKVMSAAEREEKSLGAAEVLFDTSEYRNAKSIMLYFPVGNEVNTARIAEQAHTDKKRVIYPVTDEKNCEITPVEVVAGAEFTKGGFGIHEPCGERYTGEIDLIVVPGVAFDREGGRLGFGKGCYDRFLAGVKSCKIGLCYGAQLIDCVECEEHDVRMDMIVTEDEIVRIKKNA